MTDWIELFNGKDLTGWAAYGPHEWRVAAGAALDPTDPKRLAFTEGDGIFLNGNAGRTSDIYTAHRHGSCELHIEFVVPQGSNSGVYLQGQYEIQILDSWGTPNTELTFGTCGGIYGRWVEETKTPYEGAPPRVNASRPPGEWQEYDVIFHAARFDSKGEKIANARFERITQNGVVIHENYECSGPTRGAWNEADIPLGPLRLQGDHGPVAFRNVRLRPLE
jgi:hypothetical protein